MTKRSATDLWNALDEATVDAELERVLAMTPEECRRELVATGVDLDQVRARADAIVASIPVGPQPPTDTPASRAESLRRDAREACAQRSWQTCLDKLDEARTIDPAGDEAPAVQALRRSAGAMQPVR